MEGKKKRDEGTAGKTMFRPAFAVLLLCSALFCFYSIWLRLVYNCGVGFLGL